MITFFFPIALTSVGVGIHFLGILSLFQQEVHMAIHVAMFLFDLLVVIGLLRKTAWGYWLAVILYIEQFIGVPYLCYQVFANNFGLHQLLIAGPLVTIALIILILNKKIFVQVA